MAARKVIHNPAATPDDCEPCSVVARRPARPRVKAERVSYSFTVQVNGGPRRHFAGKSLAELERDLNAAADELGSGKAAPRG